MEQRTGDELAVLVSALGALEAKANDEWMASLEARKIAEATFHDHSHQITETHEEEYSNSKFYAVTDASTKYWHEWVDTHSRDKIVLDYACGNGSGAIRAAKAGAKLAIGLDISRGSIENAKRLAADDGLNNTFFVQGDCENTGLPDSCIDSVICSGMLHHIDLTYAFPELRRILRPGGRIFAHEALNYNPLIKLYRKRTPQLRTAFEAEHIISHKDLRFASHFFEVTNVRYWHLFTILAVPFRRSSWFKLLLSGSRSVDAVLLRIPLVRNMAWQFTFELVKKGP
jgi:ubiquinone/menaquinone biosynthesis C-methylase UbiE